MRTKKLLQKEALKYLRYKDMLDQIPEEEIQLFRKETDASYAKIKQLDVQYVDFEPYKSNDEMTDLIDTSDILMVSKLHNNSRLLPGNTNLHFRAIHDYLHYLLGAEYTFKGELEVYNSQKKYYSTAVGRKILYSEVVLQAAYKEYFGKFAEYQKVII